MKKKLHPIVSAILSIVFPVGTFVALQYILFLIHNSTRTHDSSGNFGLIIVVMLLFIPFTGLGCALAFVFGIRTIYSVKELSKHQKLILTLATLGIFLDCWN